MRANYIWISICMMAVIVLAGCHSSSSDSAPATFSITGAVMLSGAGLESVTVSLVSAPSATTGVSEYAASATTDAAGNFTFTGLSSGHYIITPGKSGHAFAPYRGTVSITNQNVMGMEFTVSDQPYVVSGFVADDPIINAEVSVKDFLSEEMVGKGHTDSSGAYSINVFSRPPYRISTKDGTSQGSLFPSAITSYCETADNCHASPYTSAIDQMMQNYGLGYSESAAALTARIGIDYDPFLHQIVTGAAVPATEFDLVAARAAFSSKDAVDTWIAGLAEVGANPDADLPVGAIPSMANGPTVTCFQGLHIIGGSGTDPAQNDLMYQIYKWAKPADDCGELRSAYYTGIKVINPKDSLTTVSGWVTTNICQQISEGVRDIYIFGFSRGAVMAVKMADVVTLCTKETASYKQLYTQLTGTGQEASNIVKFVGLVDPVKTDMDNWPQALPASFATDTRSVRIRKTVTEGMSSSLGADTMQWQQFYFDTRGRIQVYSNLCVQKEIKIEPYGEQFILEQCDRSLASQKFTTEQTEPACASGVTCSVDFEKLTGVTRFRIKSQDGQYATLYPDPPMVTFRKRTSGDTQIFEASPGFRGQIKHKINAKCLSADDRKMTYTDVGFADCEPHNEGWPQILNTADIGNVAIDFPVYGSWHQDLQCTVAVSDDRISYPTNAKFVEDELIQLSREKGLHFDDSRFRGPCDDSKSLRDNPTPLYKSSGVFIISGTITSATGTPITNAWVGFSGPSSSTASLISPTDSSGQYKITGLRRGKYTIIPYLSSGHTVSPKTKTVTIVNTNITGVDFVGN